MGLNCKVDKSSYPKVMFWCNSQKVLRLAIAIYITCYLTFVTMVLNSFVRYSRTDPTRQQHLQWHRAETRIGLMLMSSDNIERSILLEFVRLEWNVCWRVRPMDSNSKLDLCQVYQIAKTGTRDSQRREPPTKDSWRNNVAALSNWKWCRDIAAWPDSIMTIHPQEMLDRIESQSYTTSLTALTKQI